VTSHIPPQSNARASGSTNSRAANGTVNKRSRVAANTRGASNQPNEYYSNNVGHDHPNGHTSSAPANSRREAFNVPPSSSSHPSLVPYQNGHQPHATPFELHARGGHSLSNTPVPGAGDWNPPHPQTLEGPGMPVSRNHANLVANGPSTADNAPPEAGDGEGDGDEKPYCFCQRVSFGQMIACDDSNCQWEWVRFCFVPCVNGSVLICMPYTSSISHV
jgi:inhibitor of growth protein 3